MTGPIICARRRQSTPEEKRLTAIIFAVVGIILIMVGYPGHKKIEETISKCTKPAPAVVLDYDKKMTTGGRSSVTLYRAALGVPEELGVPGNTVVTDWSDIRYETYDKISVRYDPNDPKCVYVPSNPPYDSGKI